MEKSSPENASWSNYKARPAFGRRLQRQVRLDAGHARVRGFEDALQWPNLTLALLRRGCSQQDVKKILGGNFLRVLRAVAGAGPD